MTGALTFKRDVIQRVQVGGEDGVWQMVGISYWTEEDGRKLVDDLPAVYGQPGGKERYWDEVPLTYCAKNYDSTSASAPRTTSLRSTPSRSSRGLTVPICRLC